MWLAIAAPFLLFPGRWAPLFFAIALIPWASRLLRSGRLTRATPMNAPAILLLLMAVIGYTVSINSQMSWARLWGIALQVVVFFAVLNGLRSEGAIVRAGILFIVGTVAVSLLSLIGTDWDIVRLVKLPQLYDRLPQLASGLPGSGVPRQSAFFNPRQVGATMALLLPVPLTFLFFSHNRWTRVLAAGAVLVGGIMLLLSQAIMGLFGFALAVAVILVWWQRWLLVPLLFLTPLLLLTAVGAVLAYASPRQLLSLLDVNHPLGIGFVLRLDMWSRALAMIGDMPLTGSGLNTFSPVQSHFYTGYIIGPEPHAHNLWLQTTVDLGVPGLLAFLALLIAFFLTVLQAYRRTENREVRILLVGLSAAAVAYIAGGTLDSLSVGQKPVAALWAIFGMAGAAWTLSPSRPDKRSPLAALASLKTVSLLLLGVATLVGAFLLVNPRPLWSNLAAIQAHRALYRARTTGELPSAQAQAVVQSVHDALARAPDDPHFHMLLGGLYAWQGKYGDAIAALERRVQLDGPDALADRVPYVTWQRQLRNAPPPAPWRSTIELYTHWLTRFPRRAEPYLLVAIARRRQGRPEVGEAIVASGIEREAEPSGLLAHYLVAGR